jgi:hypothetical protein
LRRLLGTALAKQDRRRNQKGERGCSGYNKAHNSSSEGAHIYANR